MKPWALLCAPLLAGCAFSAIKDKMSPMVGQPVSAVSAKLGFPSDERIIAGRKVYLWTSSNFVDGTNYRCQIRVIADERGNVAQWDSEGNEGGCSRFASKLGYF